MRAVQVTQWVKSVEELRVVEVPEPAPLDDEVTIEVHACGLNFYDILMVQGKYQFKPPLPFIPGTEFAGVVLQVGKKVKKLATGQRVFGTMQYGAFAEIIACKAIGVFLMPAEMTFEEAAGFAMVYATSYLGLIVRGGLKPGETVLVHAAAGGVGLAAVQIAKAAGAKVIGTVGSNEKMQVVKDSGADLVLNYNEQRGEAWVKAVNQFTSNRGADVIYDPVGGDIFDLSTKCIAWTGRLLVVGFTSGRIPEIAANRILLKNISVIGVFLGSHMARNPNSLFEYMKILSDMYQKRQLRPQVYQVFPLDEIAPALQAIGSRQSWGKVVVTPKKSANTTAPALRSKL